MTPAREPGSFHGLPGAELITKGLQDLTAGAISAEALLVLVAGPSLRRLGIDVPSADSVKPPYEHRLYEHLEDTFGAGAFSRYNALLRRVVSFVHAMERERPRS